MCVYTPPNILRSFLVGRGRIKLQGALCSAQDACLRVLNFVDAFPGHHLGDPKARSDRHLPLPTARTAGGLRARVRTHLVAAVVAGLRIARRQLPQERHGLWELRIGDRDSVQRSVIAAQNQREAGPTAGDGAQGRVEAKSAHLSAVGHAEHAHLAVTGVVVHNVRICAREEARVLENAFCNLKRRCWVSS